MLLYNCLRLFELLICSSHDEFAIAVLETIITLADRVTASYKNGAVALEQKTVLDNNNNYGVNECHEPASNQNILREYIYLHFNPTSKNESANATTIDDERETAHNAICKTLRHLVCN